MLLRQTIMEEKEHFTKMRISRLQRDRDCGVITEEQYEEQYEIVMGELRERFADIMEERRNKIYKDFHDTEGFGF